MTNANLDTWYQYKTCLGIPTHRLLENEKNDARTGTHESQPLTLKTHAPTRFTVHRTADQLAVSELVEFYTNVGKVKAGVLQAQLF